jgi:hypothetical protein
VIVVHPDRTNLDVAPADAWHFRAREMEALLQRASEGAGAA